MQELANIVTYCPMGHRGVRSRVPKMVLKHNQHMHMQYKGHMYVYMCLFPPTPTLSHTKTISVKWQKYLRIV